MALKNTSLQQAVWRKRSENKDVDKTILKENNFF